MGEFALLALFAVALLEENADDRLGVDTKGNLLNLGGLVEKQIGLPFGILSGLLLALTLRLLGLLALLLGISTVFHRGLQGGNLLLGGGTLLVLHAKRLVFDGLAGLLAGGLGILLLGRHGGQISRSGIEESSLCIVVMRKLMDHGYKSSRCRSGGWWQTRRA